MLRLSRPTISKVFAPVCLRSFTKVIHPDGDEPKIPPYFEKGTESTEIKRARLLYQSRKRGMLENDLLLSTFAHKYLAGMDNNLLAQYDKLINIPENDWDIYYWAVGARSVPVEFNTQVMKMLKEHVKNKDREQRFRQPELPSKK